MFPKFNVKSKAFIGTLVTTVLLGIGVPNADVVSNTATNLWCGFVVKCEA